MTTFQSIVFGAVHGFSEFLPIGASGHRVLVPYLLNWPEPGGALAAALAVGALLASLFYFRHDWASMISCLIQVIIFRKKPMTLDERMPLFIAVSTVPVGLAWYYLHGTIEQMEWSPLLVAGMLAAFGVPLWLSESFSRKNKGMFDWNWIDAFLVGVSEIAMLIPGCGRPAALLPGALFRNYNREAAAKFAFFAATPVLAASAILHLRETDFHAAQPMPDMSWLSFGVALVVTLLSGLLAIGGFMKNIQRRSLGQYVIYRFVMAIAVGVAYWARNR